MKNNKIRFLVVFLVSVLFLASIMPVSLVFASDQDKKVVIIEEDEPIILEDEDEPTILEDEKKASSKSNKKSKKTTDIKDDKTPLASKSKKKKKSKRPHKIDKKRYKKTVSRESVLKYYRKMKNKYKNLKAKPLKFKINFEDYDLKFTDIDDSHPNRDAIIWAVANGITKNEKRKFKPDELITIKEVIKYQWDLRGKYHIIKEESEAMGAYDRFADPDGSSMNYCHEYNNHGVFEWLVLNTHSWAIDPLACPTDIPYYEPMGTNYQSFYIYEPDATISTSDLVSLASGWYMGVIGVNRNDLEVDDYYDLIELARKEADKIAIGSSLFSYFLSEEEIKAKISHSHIVNGDTAYGFLLLQMMGYMEPGLTLDGFDLGKKITRGDFYQFMYDMAKTAKDCHWSVDLRSYSKEE